MTSFFSAEGGPIRIKFRRLVQNDMSTAMIWSKSKPDVEFQYGGHLGEFHRTSSQSHLPHCRVLPLGEFTVMIPEPHATLQGAVTWRNQCHDCATLHGVIIPSAIFKIVFRHILFFLGFLMQFVPLWALLSCSRCTLYNYCHCYCKFEQNKDWLIGLWRAAAFVSSPIHLFVERLQLRIVNGFDRVKFCRQICVNVYWT